MERRSFLLAMGAAPLMRAANDRIRLGFIGTGRMGIKNLQAALQVGGVEIVSLCDVYALNLEWAVKEAKAGKQSPRAERDFRRILADSETHGDHTAMRGRAGQRHIGTGTLDTESFRGPVGG